METIEQRKIIGKWLKAKRVAADMTPAQLAKLIKRPLSFVQKYEGGGKLELIEMAEIAQILKANLHEAVSLITLVEDKGLVVGKKKAAK